jgi:hypothetical protein
VPEILDSWPALVIVILLASLSVYLGITHLWGKIVAVFVCGTYGGFMVRGVVTRRLRAQDPGTRWIWLLSVGLTTCVAGVATRLAFPQAQGTAFDLTWVGLSFFSILAFFLLNRKDQYDWERLGDLSYDPLAAPPGPRWLISRIGVDYFHYPV